MCNEVEIIITTLIYINNDDGESIRFINCIFIIR